MLGLIFITAHSVCKIELYICIMSHVKPRNYTNSILKYSVVNHLGIYKQHDCAEKEAHFSLVSQIMSISHSKNTFSCANTQHMSFSRPIWMCEASKKKYIVANFLLDVCRVLIWCEHGTSLPVFLTQCVIRDLKCASIRIYKCRVWTCSIGSCKNGDQLNWLGMMHPCMCHAQIKCSIIAHNLYSSTNQKARAFNTMVAWYSKYFVAKPIVPNNWNLENLFRVNPMKDWSMDGWMQDAKHLGQNAIGYYYVHWGSSYDQTYCLM